MKKIILFINLALLGATVFSQEAKENGTIYISHPYIDILKKTVNAYLTKDDAANLRLYTDTAQWWSSGMSKPINIKEAVKNWDSDFTYYDSIALKVVGYPDFLHYKDKDAQVVQSWWTWIGKSKRTGVWISVDYVQFDSFNKDGKIDFEGIYGDWSEMMKNK